MELIIEQTLHSGVSAHNAGKLEEAERLYRAILQSQPAHPDANHNLGLIAVSVNQAEAALPLFKTALEANPKIEQFWLSYIDALIKEKQFDNAKQVLEQAKKQGVTEEKLNFLEIKLTPTAQVNEPKLAVQNKSLPLSQKRKKLSEQKKRKATKQNLKDISPSQQELNNLLEYYQTGRYGDAEKLAILTTQKFPDHSFAWKVLGAVFTQTGRILESLDAKHKAVELDPQDAEAHSNLANSLHELSRFDEAEVSCKKAIALNPNLAESHSSLGNTLKALGKLEEAEKSYLKAIVLEPDFAKAHNNLGNTLRDLGRLEEAGKSYLKAIASNPNLAEAHCNLGNILKNLDRLEEAEESYRKAIALKAAFPEAHSNLGNTLQELGKFKEAQRSYEKAIALKPDFAEAHNNLGTSLKELGRLEEAEVSYRNSIIANPNFSQAHCNLGNTLKERGKFKEAKISYERAIALMPGLAEAHCNLGITLQELGKLKEAKRSYERAIALKPGLAEAYNNLANVFKELGRLDEADACYQQAITFKPDYGEAHYNLGVQLFESKKYALAMEQFELTDHSESKKYAIRASYLQDDEATFFEKLDFLINQGEINATIGSLVFCSEAKYGVKKSNPFCSHPLKYFVKTDLNEHYDFENIFIKPAVDILTDDSVSHKSQSLLTNGTQTAGNLFVIEEIVGTEIESIIRAEIEKYRVYFKDSEEGFIKNWPMSYSIYGWLVSMQSGGKLDSHMHHSGWLSGSIYINVPPKSKPESGNLVLCTSDKEDLLAAEKGQESIINVVTGSLCFFPSSLHHYTIPFDEEENRIVLAFDIIPT